MLSMSLRNFLNTVTAAFGVCVLGDVCVCVCVYFEVDILVTPRFC